VWPGLVNIQAGQTGVTNLVTVHTAYLCEVVWQVERLPDLLRRLPLDHPGEGPAGQVHQRLHVQAVGSRRQLAQHARVQSDELLVKDLPLLRTRRGGASSSASFRISSASKRLPLERPL
jgi:hypothetical protein